MPPPPRRRGAVPKATFDAVQKKIRAFVAERDWSRFHSPKNLSMALAVEAAELMEIFQWMTTEESRRLPEKKRRAARDEVADVLILALNLAGVLGFDPADAVVKKLAKAARKYPAKRFRGRYE
jgi:NTP pyrophosphatase (non-canonical NTP hydrolase)